MKVIYSADGKTATYCGYTFRKGPKTGYFLCTKKTDAGKRERLHVYVYRTEHNLPVIPAGYHVHHVDMDKNNNDVTNLILLSAAEHEHLHAENIDEDILQRKRENVTANAMPKARKWHSTPKGKEWHIEHGIEAFANRKLNEYVCDNCGKTFITRHVYSIKSHKFCCNACKAESRRKSGVDNVDRQCAICGQTFRCNKYSLVKRCYICRDRNRKY